MTSAAVRIRFLSQLSPEFGCVTRRLSSIYKLQTGVSLLYERPMRRRPMPQAVAYYRVSRPSQGRSGLGIEAQREAIRRFAEAERLDIIGEHTEVETGKGADA